MLSSAFIGEDKIDRFGIKIYGEILRLDDPKRLEPPKSSPEHTQPQESQNTHIQAQNAVTGQAAPSQDSEQNLQNIVQTLHESSWSIQLHGSVSPIAEHLEYSHEPS